MSCDIIGYIKFGSLKLIEAAMCLLKEKNA